MSVSYRFQRSTSSSGPWTDLTGTWWTSPALFGSQPVGDYLYYRVVVSDSDVNGIETASDPIEVLVGELPVLTAEGGMGASHIRLDWSPDCFSEYLVYRYNRMTYLWELLETVATNYYEDPNVSQDVNYCYFIVSKTLSGLLLDRSNIACAMITPEGVFSMRSRATIYQGIQIGIESTPGTAVACAKRLLGLEVTLNPQIPVKTAKNQGAKGAVGTQRGLEHTEGSVSGALDFNTLHYMLTLLFGAATDSLDGTVDIHTWAPSALAPLTPKTATIEQGSSVGAEKVAFALMTELVIKWSKEDASLDGALIANEYQRNITMTATPTEVAAVPVNPAAIGVYISLDGNTYTLLEDTIDGEFKMSGLWAPSFHVNDTLESFDRVAEQQPEFGMTLTVEDGTETDDFMSHLYAGQKIWLGFKAVGPEITTGKNYQIKAYMPVYVVTPDFGDKDSVFGSTFQFELAHDEDGLVSIELKNDITTL